MSKTMRKTPVQSTQQNIPIKEFINGLIVTKDNKYIKLLEVLPSPFFLKRVKDQNKVSEQFHSLLKAAPDELHIKSVTVQADLSYQIKDIREHIEQEKDENCKKMGKEYENRLLEAQEYGTTHRFFISFPYSSNKSNQSLKEISYQLNVDANRLVNLLRMCGNDVITNTDEEQNNMYAKLFYMLYNRNSYISEPFEEHASEIYKKYIEETVREDCYKIKTVDCEMLVAYTDVNNHSSQKLLESCGFEKSGILHRFDKLKDKYIDDYRYELMK